MSGLVMRGCTGVYTGVYRGITTRYPENTLFSESGKDL